MSIPIMTSSWFARLPANFLRVGISRSVPRNAGPGYRRIRALEPGPWFNSVSPAEFHKRYMTQLQTLDASELVSRIEAMATDAKAEAAVLCCFESPSDPAAWCHRGQFAGWLFDRLGVEVREYGQGCACGWSHPKLFAGLRR